MVLTDYHFLKDIFYTIIMYYLQKKKKKREREKENFPFFFGHAHARQAKIPRPGIETPPQQQSKPQQWQCWILNLLHHQGTSPFPFFNVPTKDFGKQKRLNKC